MVTVARAAFTAVIAVLLLATAAAAATFTDPTGDVVFDRTGTGFTGTTLLDLTGAEITDTDELITIRISLASTQPLSPSSSVRIWIDTDKDASTGDDPYGFEADLSIYNDPCCGLDFQLRRWDGSELAVVDDTAATGTYANGVVTFTVPRRELFDTRGFAFLIHAFVFNADFSGVADDWLPDFDPLLTYDLENSAPPAPPRLAAGPMSGTPAVPRGGRRFTVSTLVVLADTGDRLPDGRTTCVARVGSAGLRAAGTFAASRARCTMTVPRTTAGKVLRGTLTVRHAGATITRPFSFRIR
jgi:hypothetical protein